MNALDRPTPVEDKNNDPNSPKNRDWFIFKPAEWFFKQVDYSFSHATANTSQPSTIGYDEADQKIGNSDNPACSHGRVFRFDDGLGFLLIQFMRPRVWRVRFHSVNKSGADFTDYNTRTIVQDTLSKTISALDLAEQINWNVELHELGSQYFVLQSVVDPDSAPKPTVQIWIQRNPFKITAVRRVETAAAAVQLPSFEPPSGSDALKLDGPPGTRVAIIWQTKERPLQTMENATVLSVERPFTAKYTGFGEQGGKRLFTDKVCMNYFNFDNMRYFNVYGGGPYDDSEPLYHSEPYWIEMNAHPGSRSQVATFIDNYSHICLDLGLSDPTRIRIATRFNSFQCILIAGDDVGQIIRSYTSLIGRPRLKPRFILGNHQGCYGYDNKTKVQTAVDKYRQYDIPLDGVHIDVDVQRDYRTFTIDTSDGKFPEPGKMFDDLRKKGIKCSTNITPVINSRPDINYTTLNEGLQKGYFVVDARDHDPGAPTAGQQIYLQFGKGNRWFLNPNDDGQKPGYHPADDVKFGDAYDSHKPFRGGVDYGDGRGAPGHYPNLNRKEVRQWWGQQYKYLFDTGLEFVWQDMTSPCMARAYGDMQSWPFRLKLDSDGWSGDPKGADQKLAIEIWSLYSYNLHKATYQGLNKLDSRKGKRNFIIGRGSFAGAQRFAGLWTGDNVSSWEFLDISVAQVLALGLSGTTITGADVGGFEPADEAPDYADPELLIRWYSAYSLLPWFRNHYTAKAGKKMFQEPYAYREFQDHGGLNNKAESELIMYYSVLPACRYIIKLRYSLLQLLYDAMFENMINGLPIARAMIITDPLDTSLYQTNQWYTRSQYLVGNDLLVAPALYRERDRNRRRLYLPYPDDWYPMNLRPDDDIIGVALQPKASGGTHIDYDCRIAPNEPQLPYITPMYVREGAIIPQIGVRDYVPDRTRHDEPPNQISIHVYPGKDGSYDMYLDDGVSRESAPDNVYLAGLVAGGDGTDEAYPDADRLVNAFGDREAKSVFRRVSIRQTTTRSFASDRLRDVRRVAIATPHKLYTDDMVRRDNGAEYRVVVWHAPRLASASANMDDVLVTVSGTDKGRYEKHPELWATVAWVPIDADLSPVIEVSSPS